MEAKYPVRVVAKRTGLSPHVIRIWERRYGVVLPERTPTNRRLYTEADLEKLSLLSQLTESGHGIGEIANLPMDTLKEMAGKSFPAGSQSGNRVSEIESVRFLMEECIQNILNLDEGALEQSLDRASLELSQRNLIEKLLAPLMIKVGELWESGQLRVAHEHFATGFLRPYIARLKTSYLDHAGGSTLVVATLCGQIHEIGAMLVAKTADSEGWRVIYLGASLPAEEIAAAVQNSHARAVALSLVYPPKDPEAIVELERLARLLPPDVPLLIGGHSANSYAATIKKCSGVLISSLSEFREILNKI